METHEMVGLVASLTLAMIGLVRYGMIQHRRLADQFVHFLETTTERRESLTERLMLSLQDLAANVGENSILLRQMSQKMQVS
jgi:hypothetical protein